MKLHSQLNSTYWHNYLNTVQHSDVEPLIREETLISKRPGLHLDILTPGNQSDCKGNIIFIHGTAVYSRFYLEFSYQMCMKGFRIILLDLPGHGLSEGRRGHFTMKNLTNSIDRVVQHVHKNFRGKIALMGSSLGGITTLYSALAGIPVDLIICHNAALFHEKAYKSIISLNGILKLLMPTVPFIAKLFPKLKLSVFNYLPANRLVNTPKGFDLYAVLESDHFLTAKYTLLSLSAQMQEAPADLIDNLSIPVLFINGEHDQLFSTAFIQSIYDRCPSHLREMEVIPGAAHLIFQENIDEVVGKITPILKKYIDN